jgi:hypothetical protein
MDAEDENQLLDPDIVLLALDILWRECQEKQTQPYYMAIFLTFPLVSKKFKRRAFDTRSNALLFLIAYPQIYSDSWYNPSHTFPFGDYITGMKVIGPVIMEFTYWDNLARPSSYVINESFEFEYPHALNYFNGFSLRCTQGHENIKAIKWRFIHSDYRNIAKLIQSKRIMMGILQYSPLVLRD